MQCYKGKIGIGMAVLLLGFGILTQPILAITTSGTLTQDEIWTGEILITGDIVIPKLPAGEPLRTGGLAAKRLSSTSIGRRPSSRSSLLMVRSILVLPAPPPPCRIMARRFSEGRIDSGGW